MISGSTVFFRNLSVWEIHPKNPSKSRITEIGESRIRLGRLT